VSVVGISDASFAVGVECGHVYNATEGPINSPNYPRDYTNDVNCAYVLQAPTGSVVELTFTDFVVSCRLIAVTVSTAGHVKCLFIA
jgi:hypothetical protein